MAPVLAQMISYESLKDGTMDLVDVALCNDAIAVRADNEELAHNHKEDR